MNKKSNSRNNNLKEFKRNSNSGLIQKLQALSDFELEKQTFICAKREQQATVEVLYHLHEVEIRRLFAKRSFASLWEYTVHALGYGESAASDRVAAMRLMFSNEEAREQIDKGILNLTAAAKIQRFLKRQEKKRREAARKEMANKKAAMNAKNAMKDTAAENAAKRNLEAEEAARKDSEAKLVKRISGKSTREVDAILATEDPEEVPRDRTRVLRPGVTEVRFSADDKLMAMVNRVRELKGNLSFSEVFSNALKGYLEKIDPELKMQKRNLRRIALGREVEKSGVEKSGVEKSGAEKSKAELGEVDINANRKVPLLAPKLTGVNRKAPLLAPKLTGVNRKAPLLAPKVEKPGKLGNRNLPMKGSVKSRYIPVRVADEVQKRSGGRCEYKDPVTKRRCNSRHRLELDHITPFAKEGKSVSGNIRHLCSQHNRLEAIRAFGKEKMQLHLWF